jgi:hypothetical protein
MYFAVDFESVAGEAIYLQLVGGGKISMLLFFVGIEYGSAVIATNGSFRSLPVSKSP